MDYKTSCRILKRLFASFLLTTSVVLPGVVMAVSQSTDDERVSNQDDIRVLIDVSGSMKKNDPGNLRASALRLFVSMLPSGVTSGVWMFDQKVKMIIPHQQVDDYWQQKARIATQKLHSKGMFTDIEQTLEQATWDWRTPDSEARRSLIILTDGMVDVSNDKKLNLESRQRILNSLLPELQKSSVTIHTIALSRNADELLLQQLAATTGGWYEKVNNSKGLERLFLRMFEKVARIETVPIKDNQVYIDDTVNEVTFLVFRKPGAPDVAINDPHGNSIAKNTSIKNVRWHHENNYDLATIRKPSVGKWKIIAQMDPDNRVSVVTNLKLRIAPIENNIASYEVFTLGLRIEENENIVTDEQFLGLINFEIEQNSQHGENWNWHFSGRAKNNRYIVAPGKFELQISKSLVRGKHEILIRVDGKTFQREFRQQVNIYDDPIKVLLQEHDQGLFKVSAIPIKGLLNFDTLVINGILVDSLGNKKQIEIARKNMSEWTSILDVQKNPGKYNLSLHVRAKSENGKNFDRWMEPMFFSSSTNSDKIIPDNTALQEIIPTHANNTHDIDHKNKANWVWVSIYVINLNLFLMLAAFYGTRLIRRWIKKSLVNPALELRYDGI